MGGGFPLAEAVMGQPSLGQRSYMAFKVTCNLYQYDDVGSVADPDRFGLDPDPASENRPDPVKAGSVFI
jgi:hypothetical protein